jgi:hypothetical protein
METQDKLYINAARKKDLVEKLERILVQQRSSAAVLDNKAWDILKTSSATFGLVSTVEIILLKGPVNVSFRTIFSFVLICYILQSILVLLVIRPRKWGLVPGTPNHELSFSAFMKNYLIEYDGQSREFIPKDDDRYYDQLLTDYLGHKDSNNPKQITKGAIAIAQAHNSQKAKLIMGISFLLVVVVVGLVYMAIAAVQIAP